MSVRGKDVRVEISDGCHERLRIMAEHHDKEISRFASELLEKAIAGEWHAFNVMLDRAARSGILRNGAERGRGDA